MSSYDYQVELKTIWEHAVKIYQDGQRGADSFFNESQTAFLRAIGATAQEVYDFAEDFVSSREPDFTTFAQLASLRRGYFLIQQNGVHSSHIVQDADLPAKKEAVRGISWLPRIIVKARAKLRGEMNPNLMFGCSGDRAFCSKTNIHLAEFLQLLLTHYDNDEAIVDYVEARLKNT